MKKRNNSIPMVSYLEVQPARVNEKISQRAMLILEGDAPCQHALKKGPCNFCAFWEAHMPGLEPGQFMDFETAVQKAGKDIGESGRLELLIGGSLLDVEQVPGKQLEKMLTIAGNANVSTILIESRPEFINSERIEHTLNLINPSRLEVAIGLETANDTLRAQLGKGFTANEVKSTINDIVRMNAYPVVYLLTGFLPDRSRACEDLLESMREIGRWQDQIGMKIRVSLESYFPLHPGGQSTQPYLTPGFIAGVVKDAVLDSELEVFIATSTEGRCVHPLDSGREYFRRFNLYQDISELEKIIDSGGFYEKMECV